MGDEVSRDGGSQEPHRPGETGHVPVLLKEAIDFLAIKPDGSYIDATVGLGGHSCEIARRLRAPGRLIGFDKDTHALEHARQRLAPVLQREDAPEVTLLHSSFAEVGERAEQGGADGLLADLGLSSLQLSQAQRGFSFQSEGPLDMRMDPEGELTADQVVNRLDERTLADVIYEFGEERRSRRIARAIVRARPIRTTAHLAQVISAAARPMNLDPTARKSGARRGPPGERWEGRIHPATKTFQAIRIYVNRELDDLKALLEAAPRVIRPGGRVVIISFHSLEDRMVKDAFRDGERNGTWRLLTKKPVSAGDEEIDRNPRARSAKLRAVERRSG